MIKQLNPAEFSIAAELIRKSFSTVAKEFGLTAQNCPTHTSFITTEDIQKHFEWGWLMYGFYEDNQIVGHISISKSQETDGAYEPHNLAVLPEYRHKGYGKQLLDFCKAKAKDLGGTKLHIGIIEENTVLKNWYAANGFIHTGTKRFPQFPFIVGFMEWEVV